VRQRLLTNSIKLRNLILALFSILPVSIVTPRGDVLESYKFISPDGLDWITQGRILGADGLVLPVLRNLGYVLSSRLDWILGGHGFIFAAINCLGLLLQGISLILILDYFKIKVDYQTLGIFIYFGSWIHFSSLYILPDSFAVGCLVFGTTLFAVSRAPNKWRIALSLLVISLGSLFQFYAFAGFVFSFALMFLWKNQKTAKIWFAVVICVLMAITIGSTLLWRSFIPHLTVPSQFELLAANLKMLPFYSEVWSLGFITLIFLIIGFSKRKNLLYAIRNELIQFYFLFSLVFLILALCYQWPDSRIAYTGIAFSLITLIAIFLRSLTNDLQGSTIKSDGTSSHIRGVYIITIAFSLFLAPSNYWEPKLFETRPLYTWSLIAAREAIRNEPSNYLDISISIKNSCNTVGEKQRILDFIASSDFSPYEKTVLNSYSKHFACANI
jgi:hypothetical protein